MKEKIFGKYFVKGVFIVCFYDIEFFFFVGKEDYYIDIISLVEKYKIFYEFILWLNFK